MEPSLQPAPLLSLIPQQYSSSSVRKKRYLRTRTFQHRTAAGLPDAAQEELSGRAPLFLATGLPGAAARPGRTHTVCVVPVCTEGRRSCSARRHQILDPRHLIGCFLASCLCLHLPLCSMYVPEGPERGLGGRWWQGGVVCLWNAGTWLSMNIPHVGFSSGLPELPRRSLVKMDVM